MRRLTSARRQYEFAAGDDTEMLRIALLADIIDAAFADILLLHAPAETAPHQLADERQCSIGIASRWLMLAAGYAMPCIPCAALLLLLPCDSLPRPARADCLASSLLGYSASARCCVGESSSRAFYAFARRRRRAARWRPRSHRSATCLMGKRHIIRFFDKRHFLTAFSFLPLSSLCRTSDH